ncbi:Protein of unknown function DUF3800 [Candidatus Nanopelagicaceae bacterium]
MEIGHPNRYSVYIDESMSRQYPLPDIYVIAAVILPHSSFELHSNLSKLITLETYKSSQQFKRKMRLQPKNLAHWINEVSPRTYISYNWQYLASLEAARALCLRTLFQELSRDGYFNLVLDSRESIGHGKLFLQANHSDRKILNYEINSGRVAQNMRMNHLTDQKEPLLHCADMAAYAARVHILGQDSEVFNLLNRTRILNNIYFN